MEGVFSACWQVLNDLLPDDPLVAGMPVFPLQPRSRPWSWRGAETDGEGDDDEEKDDDDEPAPPVSSTSLLGQGGNLRVLPAIRGGEEGMRKVARSDHTHSLPSSASPGTVLPPPLHAPLPALLPALKPTTLVPGGARPSVLGKRSTNTDSHRSLALAAAEEDERDCARMFEQLSSAQRRAKNVTEMFVPSLQRLRRGVRRGGAGWVDVRSQCEELGLAAGMNGLRRLQCWFRMVGLAVGELVAGRQHEAQPQRVTAVLVAMVDAIEMAVWDAAV